MNERVMHGILLVMFVFALVVPTLGFETFITMKEGCFYDPTTRQAWVPPGVADWYTQRPPEWDSWSFGGRPGQEALLGIWFDNSTNGYAVGANGSIFRSANGGVTRENLVPQRELFADDVRWRSRGEAPNMRPRVNAGHDQERQLPLATVTLNGVMTDDGLPLGSPVGLEWSLVSGPGTVELEDPTALSTKAEFSTNGIYALRLKACDGELLDYDTVLVDVCSLLENEPPSVFAGHDREISFPSNQVSLTGVVMDDGLPNPPGITTSQWAKLSGPGAVVFADAGSATTTAAFSSNGVYILVLAAYDGERVVSDEVEVTVCPETSPNDAPNVNAGQNAVVGVGKVHELNGVVVDDGLPAGRLLITWSKVFGPGEVDFTGRIMSAIQFGVGGPDGNMVVNTSSSTATFSQPGTYVLRLTAYDESLTSQDELLITVVPPFGVETLLSEKFTGSDLATLTTGVWTVENHAAGHSWELDVVNQRMKAVYSTAVLTEDTWLISPPIDCTSYSNVCVKFWEQFKGGCLDHWSYGYIFGSTDGGVTWSAYSNCVHSYPPEAPEATEDAAVRSLDMSWADGHSNVKLAWRYHGNCDNWWMIDDVEVTGELPAMMDRSVRFSGKVAQGGGNQIVVPTEPGMTYEIQYTDHPLSNGVIWLPFANQANGVGRHVETNAGLSTFTFVDDEGPQTTGESPRNGRRYYRISVSATP